MDVYESSDYRFIIRIWLEETVEESGRALWRGKIAHVSSNEQAPIQELSDIVRFIRRYVMEMET